MTEAERIQKYYNKVDTLSAVCRYKNSWAHGDYPELEIGKTYKISHIGVLRSSTKIMLQKYQHLIEDIAIPAHLREIEREHNVTILLAVESGSRAWGFHSNDSDWDVRMIYVHKPEWYLRVKEQRDLIEYMYDDDVDLSGWELRKALGLLSKGNTTIFEWLHSP